MKVAECTQEYIHTQMLIGYQQNIFGNRISGTHVYKTTQQHVRPIPIAVE